MKEFLLLFAASILFFLTIEVYVLRLPLVYRSWSTKECVKVEPESAGTCDDLPKRYEIVWVK